MRIHKTIEVQVCDSCKKEFNGQVMQFGGGEFCTDCFNSATPDMQACSEVLVAAISYRNRHGLMTRPRDVQTGIWILGELTSRDYMIMIEKADGMNRAKEIIKNMMTRGWGNITLLKDGKKVDVRIDVTVEVKE